MVAFQGKSRPPTLWWNRGPRDKLIIVICRRLHTLLRLLMSQSLFAELSSLICRVLIRQISNWTPPMPTSTWMPKHPGSLYQCWGFRYIGESEVRTSVDLKISFSCLLRESPGTVIKKHQFIWRSSPWNERRLLALPYRSNFYLQTVGCAQGRGVPAFV